MHPASEQHIPDGLLAASVLLAEKPRQGSATSTHAMYQGFGVAISSTSLGIKGSLYDGDVRSRCTGKERDTESGLDYFGARYYASNMGRWMSPDWAATPAAVPYANLADPQSLNLYEYVANNPVGRADFDGHLEDMGDFFANLDNLSINSVRSQSRGKHNDLRTAWQHIKSFFGFNTFVTTATISAGAGIAGPPFANQLPNLLNGELSTMNGMGVTPLSPGAPGFAASAEQAAGQVNWILGTNGELLTTPALDGITHAATAGGADVLGAGTAQVATGGGQTVVFDITAQSGHYMNGATAAQSEGAIDAGAAAFSGFVDTVLRDFIPPMVLTPQLQFQQPNGPI